jgi:uncharacterized protein (DUF58 family)
VKPLFWILYRLYRFVSWMRYWALRRFTLAGLALLVALGTMGAMGVDTENTVAYQAFAVIFFLLLLSLVGGGLFRARFSATRRLPRFGSVGQPFEYQVTLRNLTARTQTGLFLLEDLVDTRPSFETWLALRLADERHFRSFRFGRRHYSTKDKPASVNEALVPTVRPGAEVDARVQVTPLRRGPLEFHGVSFARPDPLGLFRTFVRVPLRGSVLILPKRYLLPPVPLPGTLKYQPGGVALASHVGQSDEFVALRDYRHGDPLRHIHWRSWAKVGKPVVKEFEDEFFVRHALVLDTFTDHPRDQAFEEAVSVAASFACTIPSQESLLDLLFVGPQSYRFTAGRGLAQADQMLEVLAAVKPCCEQPFKTLEHLVLNHADLVSGCIFVLLAWDEARRSLVEKLVTLGVPVLVLVVVAPGQLQSLEAGPLLDPAGLHVLETGRIEEGLARLAQRSVPR